MVQPAQDKAEKKKTCNRMMFVSIILCCLDLCMILRPVLSIEHLYHFFGAGETPVKLSFRTVMMQPSSSGDNHNVKVKSS